MPELVEAVDLADVLVTMRAFTEAVHALTSMVGGVNRDQALTLQAVGEVADQLVEIDTKIAAVVEKVERASLSRIGRTILGGG